MDYSPIVILSVSLLVTPMTTVWATRRLRVGCSWPTSCILNSQKKEEKFKPLYFARVQVNYCVILLCGKKNSKCLCLLCFLASLELNTEKIMRSRHDSEDKCWASFWLQQLVSFAKYLSLYLETPAVLGIGCQSIRCEEESQLFFFFSSTTPAARIHHVTRSALFNNTTVLTNCFLSHTLWSKHK